MASLFKAVVKWMFGMIVSLIGQSLEQFGGYAWEERAPPVVRVARMVPETENEKRLKRELAEIRQANATERTRLEREVGEQKELRTQLSAQVSTLEFDNFRLRSSPNGIEHIQFQEFKKKNGELENELKRVTKQLVDQQGESNDMIKVIRTLSERVESAEWGQRLIVGLKKDAVVAQEKIESDMQTMQGEYAKRVSELTILTTDNVLLKSQLRGVNRQENTDEAYSILLEQYESERRAKSELLSHMQCQSNEMVNMTNEAEERTIAAASLSAENKSLKVQFFSLKEDIGRLLGEQDVESVTYRFRNPLSVLSKIQEELVCPVSTACIITPTMGPIGHVYNLDGLMACWNHADRRCPMSKVSLRDLPTVTNVCAVKNICKLLNDHRMA